jgi:hypothetical protein
MINISNPSFPCLEILRRDVRRLNAEGDVGQPDVGDSEEGTSRTLPTRASVSTLLQQKIRKFPEVSGQKFLLLFLTADLYRITGQLARRTLSVSTSGCLFGVHFLFSLTTKPNLRLKIRPRQPLG